MSNEHCATCAILGSMTAALVCPVCEYSRVDTEANDELMCLRCRHSDEDIHGVHCGPCLDAWPYDVPVGPGWTPL